MSWFASRPIHNNAIWHALAETMTCPLCGKQTSARGFRQHLNRCLPRQSATLDDYIRDHWNVLFHPCHALVARVFSLMDFDQDHFGWQWMIERPVNPCVGWTWAGRPRIL